MVTSAGGRALALILACTLVGTACGSNSSSAEGPVDASTGGTGGDADSGRVGTGGAGGRGGTAGSGGGSSGIAGAAVDGGSGATGAGGAPIDGGSDGSGLAGSSGVGGVGGMGGAGTDGGTDAAVDASSDGGSLSEGSLSDPVDLTGQLPHDGRVGPTDPSYYVVTGLLPDTVYTITLMRSGTTPMVNVPNGGSGGSVSCGFQDTSTTSNVTCAMRTDSMGNLPFNVPPRGGEPAGTFTLEVAEGGVVNEGSPASPVVLTTFPAGGGALFQSYYRVTGLVPFAPYTFSVPSATDDVAFFLYRSSAFQSTQSVCSLNVATSPMGECVVTANGAGELFVLSNAQNGALMVQYQMDLVPGGVANQGSRDDPRDLTGLLPFAGSVSVQNSYYRVDGLTPGDPYTVTLSSVTDIVFLDLFGPGQHLPGGRERDCQQSSGGTLRECVSVADAAGSIRIEISGGNTASGATYTIDVTAGGIPNEGYGSAPVDATAALPRASTLYNGSVYVVTGLAAQSYTVRATNPTADVQLSVYGDSAPLQNLLCSSFTPGVVDESCAATPSGGQLAIRVSGANAGVMGAGFMLDVQSAP